MNRSTISLDFKCPKEWDKMLHHKDGKFCTDCKEVVTDFSQVSIGKLGSVVRSDTKEKLCGNFYAHQLEKPFNNWRDKVVTLYQRVSLFQYSNKYSHKTVLLLMTLLLITTGCHRHVRGKTKIQKNPSKKDIRQLNQIPNKELDKK
jgi:hypothetical protein